MFKKKSWCWYYPAPYRTSIVALFKFQLDFLLFLSLTLARSSIKWNPSGKRLAPSTSPFSPLFSWRLVIICCPGSYFTIDWTRNRLFQQQNSENANSWIQYNTIGIGTSVIHGRLFKFVDQLLNVMKLVNERIPNCLNEWITATKPTDKSSNRNQSRP